MDTTELKTLLGLSKEDAAQIVHTNGYIVRVIREDEKKYNIKRDFNAKRINFEIDDEEVTKAFIG